MEIKFVLKYRSLNSLCFRTINHTTGTFHHDSSQGATKGNQLQRYFLAILLMCRIAEIGDVLLSLGIMVRAIACIAVSSLCFTLPLGKNSVHSGCLSIRNTVLR